MAEPKRPPLRVMLVDDHEVVRDGIRAMLAAEDDIHVTTEAATVREAIDEADRTKPDVMVMDVRLTDGSGIEATREIRAKHPDNEAFEAAFREVGVRTGRSGEDLLGWLCRRHSETFATEHQFSHVETALEQAGVRQRPTPNVEAAAFADLTGYTSLAEEAGDAAAADVSLALARLVKETAARHRGEVVKMLGDGVHFHVRDPHDAVRASLDVVRQVVHAAFPLHTSASMPGR